MEMKWKNLKEHPIANEVKNGGSKRQHNSSTTVIALFSYREGMSEGQHFGSWTS